MEDGIKWNRDVYPLSILRKEWRHNLMVAFTSREYLALLNDLHDLWRKPRAWIVRYTYYNELHDYQLSIVNYSLSEGLKVAARLQLHGIVEGEDGVTQRGGEVAATFASLNDDLGDVVEGLHHVL